MPIEVSDKMSNLNDQIVNAAKVIGRSKDRRKAFEEVYRGKRIAKTKAELLVSTGLGEVRLLQVLKELKAHEMVERTKIDGETAFKKIAFYSHYKTKILRYAGNSKALARIPTKTNPKVHGGITRLTVAFPRKSFDVGKLTIDDIDSFKKVRKVKPVGQLKPVDEEKFKAGVQRILNEKGAFKDWGGEKDDLYTTRLQLDGRRITAAFAFKGKGKKGMLRPNMLGKNGDQIQRLFEAKAEIFVLQYWYQVHESVYELMHKMAVATSAELGKKVLYCIIDGQDTTRLVKAYKHFFQTSSVKQKG